MTEKASIKSLGTINHNSLTIQNTGTSVRGLLIGSSSDSTREFVYNVVIAKNGNNSYTTEIMKGSNITVTASSSGITVSTSASYNTGIFIIAYAGDVDGLSAN